MFKFLKMQQIVYKQKTTAMTNKQWFVLHGVSVNQIRVMSAPNAFNLSSMC
jgi:hypothetical protein